MRRPRPRSLSFLTVVLLLAAALAPRPALAAEPEAAELEKLSQALGAAWSFMAAGSLQKAEDALTGAYELRAGKDSAELYYALAAVWWDRRNAMASYSWLREAEAAQKNTWYWDGGQDGAWDRRIEGRRRYIERNFTVIKVRHPLRGKALPPLAVPAPQDPLLRGFTDALPGQLQEGAAADAGIQWFFLPNGTYLVGGQELLLEGGEMEPTRAESWQLSPDSGKARRLHLQELERQRAAEEEAEAEASARLAALQEAWERQAAAGGSEAAPAEAAPAEAAPAEAAPAEAAPAEAALGEAAPAEVRATPPEPSVPASSAGGEEIQRATPLESDPNQKPLGKRLVTWDTTRKVSDDISARWRSGGFYARYFLTCFDAEAAHAIDFPDAGFSVRFADGGELKVRGTERLTEKLRSDWLVGATQLNQVELWYDGRKLLVVVNGLEFGPVTVSRRRSIGEPVGRWEIALSHARAEIHHLWIEPWDGAR